MQVPPLRFAAVGMKNYLLASRIVDGRGDAGSSTSLRMHARRERLDHTSRRWVGQQLHGAVGLHVALEDQDSGYLVDERLATPYCVSGDIQ